MNKFLFSALFLFLLSCSPKKQEDRTQDSSQKQQTQVALESSQPAYFQSEQYPLRIDYLPGLKFNMEVRRKNRGEKPFQSFPPEAYTYDWLSLDVDISNEFPEEEEPGVTSGIFSIDFYPTEQDFKDFVLEDPFTVEEQLLRFGNIPALQHKGDPSGYVLFTPGAYSFLVIMGRNVRKHNPEEISQAYSDRVADITKQMLQRIRWLKPIDVHSQEFKAWKQHILDLIAEANRKGSDL